MAGFPSNVKIEDGLNRDPNEGRKRLKHYERSECDRSDELGCGFVMSAGFQDWSIWFATSPLIPYTGFHQIFADCSGSFIASRRTDVKSGAFLRLQVTISCVCLECCWVYEACVHHYRNSSMQRRIDHLPPLRYIYSYGSESPSLLTDIV